MQRVLRALEPVRARVGRVGIVGHRWGSPPPWANPTLIEDDYYSDARYLKKLDVEVLPPIPFGRVIASMGRGVFHPVVLRPLFNRLQLMTCVLQLPKEGASPCREESW